MFYNKTSTKNIKLNSGNQTASTFTLSVSTSNAKASSAEKIYSSGTTFTNHIGETTGTYLSASNYIANYIIRSIFYSKNHKESILSFLNISNNSSW